MENVIKFKSRAGNNYKLRDTDLNDRVGKLVEWIGINMLLKVVKAEDGSHIRNGDLVLVSGAIPLDKDLHVFRSKQIVAYLENA